MTAAVSLHLPLTIAESVLNIAVEFQNAALPTPGLDARVLAAAACGMTREDMILAPHRALRHEEAGKLKGWVERRLAGEPVSRILGEREFWSLPFKLTPDVLDPRPETEVLVETVLKRCQSIGLSRAPLRILDLGTGSGCILAALLSELPFSFGVGVDISETSLRLARENLMRLGLQERAAFLCSSWIDGVRADAVDIVVSNPPYLSASDFNALTADVAKYDPRVALDGGEDGLDAYRALISSLSSVLKPGGFFAVEVGRGQAEPVMDLFGAFGFDRTVGTCFEVRDLSGVKRVVAGVRQPLLHFQLPEKTVGNAKSSGYGGEHG